MKYETFMAPLEKFYLKTVRQNLMENAKGKTLEIGFGNGANMPYYDLNKITELHALDVSTSMKQYDTVIYHQLSAETLPFEDKSFDTIVITLALCSIPDYNLAIKEIYRVLKDDGQYLFVEHEEPQTQPFKFLFNFVNPVWMKLSGGCRINLKTHEKLMKHNFKLEKQSKVVFHYGIAKKDI